MSVLAALVRRDGTDGKDAGQELVELLQNPFNDQLSATGLYSALAISLGFTAFTAIAFSLLRPYNQAIYAPKLKHLDEKHAPPPLGKQPWAWITPLVNTKELTLVHQLGMDATIFLRFVCMCRNMFLLLTVIGVGVLVPINLMNYKSNDSSQDKGQAKWLLKITPRNVSGPAIWSQVVVAWLFDLIIVFFLWWNYRKVLNLRRMYFESPEYQNSLHSRTLMLYDLPPQGTSDEGIARIIDSVAPNSSFARTVVARNVKDLPELIEEHDKAVRKLEKVLAKYLRDPANLPAARPSCKPSKKDRAHDTYPKGQKVDAIDYYTQRIRTLEVEIKEVRASVDRRGTMPYGFASYSEIPEAHSIASACRKKRPHGATVTLAPRPTDIIWRNMPLSRGSRSRRRWINNFWIAVLTVLWIAPNAMMAIFLVNLGNLGKVWPAFQRSLQDSKTFWGMVQGIASPALTSLVYLVLPMIFRRLSIKGGDQTKTGRERHVLGNLFAFFVFNNLIVFSFFSIIWTFVAQVVKKSDQYKDVWKAIVESDLPSNIVSTFCNNSPFWVTYLLQRQLGAAVDLAQLWSLIVAFFTKKFSSPTPRELIELTAPPPFEYASYYNYFLFYSTVTLCFATIQPLVLPATAMYFAIDSYLKKYLLLYRFVTKTESGGVFWKAVFNRMVLGTILANLVVLLTCWARGDGNHLQFYAVCPLPFVMIGFKLYCRSAFDEKIRYYSTRSAPKSAETAQGAGEARLRSEKLASRFGNPALYKPLITPMVHQKAQAVLPSVYRGRLSDGRDADAGDLMSVSGYSDMYALDSMKGGKVGKAANGLPGFEYVSESHMDFEYYKNRTEFTEDHGGGEMYGRDAESLRTATPAPYERTGTGITRPESPMMGGRSASPYGRPPRRVMTDMSDTSYGAYRSHTPGSDSYSRGRSPMYAHDNGSTSGLVHHAADMPMAPPHYSSRDGSVDRGRMGPARMNSPGPNRMQSPPTAPGPGPSIGALGGGPQGYSGLAQTEETDHGDSQYSYFRGSRRPPGQGW